MIISSYPLCLLVSLVNINAVKFYLIFQVITNCVLSLFSRLVTWTVNFGYKINLSFNDDVILMILIHYFVIPYVC